MTCRTIDIGRDTREGYLGTSFLLRVLPMVELALLVRLGLVVKLWYYAACRALKTIAFYLPVSSVWCWVSANRI
ncbi:MAG: hypothetical protein PVJ53_00815 [Desulfobacterales bacterium]|jgi:hypothetical protein